MKKLLSLLLVLTMLIGLAGCAIWDDYSAGDIGSALNGLIDLTEPTGTTSKIQLKRP